MSDMMRNAQETMLAFLLLFLLAVPSAAVTAAPASEASEVPVRNAPEPPEAGLQQPQQPGAQRPDVRQAQEPEQLSEPIELHPEAEEAISRLRSPWCPGLMLEVCPSREAAAFRDTLQTMAQQGIESDSLVAWTLTRYGEEWRAVPQTEGAGLLAWVIPPLALILGMGVIFLVLRRLRGGSGASAGGERRPISDEDRERLAEAMEEMEKEGR